MPEIRIINRPDLRGGMRTLGELGFTGAMWALWGYLFLPVLNLIFWIVGVRHVYLTVFGEETYRLLLDLLGRVGWTVLFLFILLRGWGLYNYWRFSGRDRRKCAVPAASESLAAHFHLTPDDVRMLQGQKEMTVLVGYGDLQAGSRAQTVPFVAGRKSEE